MDFFEVIEKRHSYRGQYEDIPIPKADLIKILDAGIRAPSGHNAQTTSFYMVTNQALIEELAQLFTYNKANITTTRLL